MAYAIVILLVSLSAQALHCSIVISGPDGEKELIETKVHLKDQDNNLTQETAE